MYVCNLCLYNLYYVYTGIYTHVCIHAYKYPLESRRFQTNPWAHKEPFFCPRWLLAKLIDRRFEFAIMWV